MIKDKQFYRRFFSLTGTIALQNLIVFGVNLADNIMLGAYSETALSGAAMANQVQFLLQSIVVGFGSGASVIMAQYWGKKQIEPIRRVFAVVFWLALASGLGLAVLVYTKPYAVLGLLTNEAAVIEQGVQYIRIMAFSYGAFTITNTLFAVLRSVQTVKIGFYVSLSTLLVNVFLNYSLIYGNFGFPEMGVQGAAIATLTARLIELLVALVYVRFFDKKLHLRLNNCLRVQWSYCRDYLRHGLPLMLSSFSWGIAMGIQSAILGRLGTTAIAANAIATTLFQVITVVTYASANAAAVLIGNAVGEGDIPRVKQMSKTMQLLFLGIGLATSALLLLTRGTILDLYNAAPATREMANQFILVLSVTVIGTAYQMAVLTGIVSGGGNTHFVLFNDLIFMWGIVLPVAMLSAFVFQWPVLVTFICLKADQVLKCAVAVVKVNRYKWIRVLTRDTDAA